jgi:microcystin-dependent protein
MSRNYRSIAEPKTLNGDVSNSATQITLNNVTGLPSPPYVLVINPDTASEEVVLVTTNQDGVTAPTLKVERAIETGATAKTHTNTNVVRHMIVGSDLQLVHDHLDNTTTAHGATGAVVGTTNTQTLTNKTLTTPKINENVTVTATSTELNVLDGITASTAELNYTDGVTSAIQTQLNTKAPSFDPTFTGAVVLPSTTSIGTVSATELGYVDGVTSAIQTQLNTLTSSIAGIVTVPTGVISPYAGLDSNIPTGYLLCNGQEVSRTTYATLFGVVSTTYGLGNNSTTFNLPDLRGRAPIGAGTGTGLTARALGATVGTETHTLITAEMPVHNHTSLILGSGGGSTGIPVTASANTNTTTGDAGSGQAHPNMQPSLALNFIIKF